MKRLLVFSLVSALALPAIASANPLGPGPIAADPEISQLRREIAAAKLDKLLDLSRSQAQQLLPILKEGQALVEQIRADREKRKPQILAALTQIRDDIRKNGVASEAAVAALKQARADTQMKDIHAKMRALREKARAVATQDQLSRLAQFDPHPAGEPEGDLDGEAPGRGPGGPEGHGPKMHHGGHMGEKRHHRAVMMTAVTPEFASLVQARAR